MIPHSASGGFMRVFWLFLLALAILAMPAHGFAQSDSPSNQPFFRWEAAGGFGMLLVEEGDLTAKWGEFSGEFGRYWTPHLKTSVVVSSPGETKSQYTQLAQGYSVTQTSARGAALSATVTYQFRENVFAHPYALAGVRLTWLSDTIETYSTSPPYQVVTETTPTRLDARPIFGGGGKWYFTSRAFFRTELLVAADPRRSINMTVRVLGGADF